MRRPRIAEASALAELEQRAHGLTRERTWFRGRLRLQPTRSGILLAALGEAGLVGYLVYDYYWAFDGYYLVAVGVLPEYHRRRIGSALIGRLLAQADEERLACAAHAPRSSRAAISLLAGFGFKRAAEGDPLLCEDAIGIVEGFGMLPLFEEDTTLMHRPSRP